MFFLPKSGQSGCVLESLVSDFQQTLATRLRITLLKDPIYAPTNLKAG